MKETQLELDFSPKPAPPASGQETLNGILSRTYLQYLQSDQWRVRKKGARGLGEIGQYHPVVVQALEKLTADSDGRVREEAARALEKIWNGCKQ